MDASLGFASLFFPPVFHFHCQPIFMTCDVCIPMCATLVVIVVGVPCRVELWQKLDADAYRHIYYCLSWLLKN